MAATAGVGFQQLQLHQQNFEHPRQSSKECFFLTGTAKDAADFFITITKLSGYVGTQSYRGAATAWKVLKMTPSVFNKPYQSTGAKFKDDLGMQEREMLVLDY